MGEHGHAPHRSAVGCKVCRHRLVLGNLLFRSQFAQIMKLLLVPGQMASWSKPVSCITASQVPVVIWVSSSHQSASLSEVALQGSLTTPKPCRSDF